MNTWIDDAVAKAMDRYLKTCEVGGMEHDKAEEVRGAIKHAGELGAFSMAVAEEMSRQGMRLVYPRDPDEGG